MLNFSFQTARLEAFTEETGVSFYEGTCWFCNKGNAIFLVSNYHILCGRRVSDLKAFHQSGAIPGKIKVYCRLAKELSKSGDGSRQIKELETVILLDIKDYKVHWNEALRSDVAAIEITEVCSNFSDGYCLQTWNLEELSRPSKPLAVMDDLFIIGFPQTALTRQIKYPIYKSASIASEPEATVAEGFFLADGKTKSGMSGSPVIVRDRLTGAPSETGFKLSVGESHLVGIYSGRDEDDPDLFKAELGRIWLVEETLLAILK